MKNIIALTVLAVALLGITANAQTNTLNTNAIAMVCLSPTNAASGKTAGAWEVTLGGGGESIHGKDTFGLDFSLSTNPFEKRPEVWVGLAQGLYWEPTFAGSSDLFVDWSQNLWQDTLDLNVGWSGGALYDNTGASAIWRTGPEATLQYYTSDNAFIFAGVNYDMFTSDRNDADGVRYSFGIGLSF